MRIDREWIAKRIPHQGSMCLLDGVESWDQNTIVCITNTHLNPHNPLRANGRLGITNAIEYAAQAMAVHCALMMDTSAAPASGYLTSVRQVQWHRARLDDIAESLRVRAERVSGSDINVLYNFEIYTASSLPLAEGRASVVLNAAELSAFTEK